MSDRSNYLAKRLLGLEGFSWLDTMAWRATGEATGGHIRTSQRGRVSKTMPPPGTIPDIGDKDTVDAIEVLVRRRHYLASVRVDPPSTLCESWAVFITSAAPWQGPVASQRCVEGASKARALVAALASEPDL
jgi:hypothetical protein